MQKQSAFAQLGKRAYGMFTAPGGAPAAPSAPLTLPEMPQMPAMATIAPLGGSVGSQYGQTIKAPAPTAAPVSKPTGMPAAGTPVTPGMSTDERMHAQNKLNPSAGGTVAVQKAPNAEDIAAFRKQTGTNFNPKSRMDMQNMHRLMGGSETIDRKQYGRTQQLAGPQFNKTAFAQLEKGAGIPAGKLLRTARQVAMGATDDVGAAARRASRATLHDTQARLPIGGPLPSAGGAMDDAAAAARRATRASDLDAQARLPMGKTPMNPNVVKGLKIGAGTIAGGGALYGAHSMGHNSGRESGVIEGTDRGIDLGLQGAQAMQPGDPGFMGRLGDLFTGAQAGPDAATMRQGLSTERDKLIQSLLAR